MARSPVPIQVIGPAGDAVAGAEITLKNRVDSSNATHYSAETGGSSSSGVMTTDTLGEPGRWATPGRYLVDLTPPSPNPLGLSSRTNVPIDIASGLDIADTATVSHAIADDTLSYSIVAGSITESHIATTANPTIAGLSIDDAANSRLYFKQSTILKWQIRHIASTGELRIADEVSAGTMAQFYPATQNSPLQDFGGSGTWSATAGAVSASGGKIRTRWYVGAGRMADAVNGERGIAGASEDDTVLVDDVIGVGATHWWSNYHDITHDAKGAFGGIGIRMTASKPAGMTYPDTYNETAPTVTHVLGQNKGAYLVCHESQVDIFSTTEGPNGSAGHADAGPARSRNLLVNTFEHNAYSTYSAGNFGAGSSFIASGAMGVQVLSQGTKRLGTGIMMFAGSQIGDEAVGESGFVRAFVLRDTTSAAIFTLDGFGRIGFGTGMARDQTTNVAGLPAWLNFTADTVEAGGINFGVDVELYRSAPDRLKLKDGFDVNAGLGTTSAIAGGFAGVYLSNAGRVDVGRGATTLECLRVYGVAGDANPRFLMVGSGTATWQAADGTDALTIADTGVMTWAGDTILQRTAADTLHTPDAFGVLSTAGGGASGNGVFLATGGRVDVTRATGGVMMRGFDVAVGTTEAMSLGDGQSLTNGLRFGPSTGALDTSLYRTFPSSVPTMRMDNAFQADGKITGLGDFTLSGNAVLGGTLAVQGAATVTGALNAVDSISMSATGGAGFIQMAEQTVAVSAPSSGFIRSFMDGGHLMMRTNTNTRIVRADRAASVYTTTGVVADRAMSDPATIGTPELGHVLGTLIADLQAEGILA